MQCRFIIPPLRRTLHQELLPKTQTSVISSVCKMNNPSLCGICTTNREGFENFKKRIQTQSRNVPGFPNPRFLSKSLQNKFFGYRHDRNYSDSKPPFASEKELQYDPESDTFIQDLLKEIGQDFSMEKSPKPIPYDEFDEEKRQTLDLSEKETLDSGNESDIESSSTSRSDDESSSDAETRLRCSVQPDSLVHEADPLQEYEDIDAFEEEEFEEVYERVHAVPLKRGKHGVFDVEELVVVLQDENAQDLCVLKVPSSFSYVDYMVIVSGRSTRHVRAMAEYVRWLHKRKRNAEDHVVKIEGENAPDWKALDLGNIALHICLPSTREMYDLETLWSVGAKYDDKTHELEQTYSFLSGQEMALPGIDAPGYSYHEVTDHAVPDKADGVSEDSYSAHSDAWHQGAAPEDGDECSK